MTHDTRVAGGADDIFDRLHQLRRDLARLQEVAATLRACTSPGAEAHDPTRAVQVVIDGDGIPVSLRVQPGWQRHVDPGALGEVTTSTYLAAVSSGMHTLSEALERSPWKSQAAHSDRLPPDEDQPVEMRSPAVATDPHPVRELRALADDVLATLRVTRAQAVAAPPTVVATAAMGAVSLTLSTHGLQECRIDPRWAAQQSTHDLNSALHDALHSARDELAKVRVPGSLTDTAQGLRQEALATLLNLCRNAGHGEE
jgi:hypothetical protein